jgi:dihydroxy-acid dehydratase
MLENAVSVQMASGGSTNAVLHILALADELGIEFDISEFDAISRRVPHICGGLPSGPYSILDIHKAGGVPTIMLQIGELIHGDLITITGKTVSENLIGRWVLDEEVIRPRSNPFHAEGGVAILRGNLAPDSAVVKQSGVPESMLVFRGAARVFENEAESIEASLNREFKAGEVIVIRNEGPKGGPGMREILTVTEQLFQMGLEEQVAIITDARFSGFTRGPAIGHVCPEAWEGGPLAAVRNGDFIKIDIPARTLELEISQKEMDKRLREWRRPQRKLTGHLAKYAALVSSAHKGAVVKV